MDVDDAAAHRREAALAEVAQDAVDVDAGQPADLGDVGLGQRQREALAVGEADGAQAQLGLAEEVRDAPVRGQAAELEDPLAVDGRVEQGREPELAGERRLLGDERVEVGVGTRATSASVRVLTSWSRTWSG